VCVLKEVVYDTLPTYLLGEERTNERVRGEREKQKEEEEGGGGWIRLLNSLLTIFTRYYYDLKFFGVIGLFDVMLMLMLM
jgi:hypothetical protein